jgi:hypothetical protein
VKRCRCYTAVRITIQLIYQDSHSSYCIGGSEMKDRIAYCLAAAALLLGVAGGTFAIATASIIEHDGTAPLAAEATPSDKFASPKAGGNGNNEVGLKGLLCGGTDAGGYEVRQTLGLRGAT